MSVEGGGPAVLPASYRSVCKPRWPNAEAPPPGAEGCLWSGGVLWDSSQNPVPDYCPDYPL